MRLFDWLGGITKDKTSKELLDKSNETLQAVKRLEKKVSELGDKVAELGTAVQGLKDLVDGGKVAELQQAIADLKAEDAAEDSAFQEQISNLENLVNELQTDQASAIEGIDAAIEGINSAVAGTPDEPTEEPNPDDTPHPDQTLPGDLPEDKG